MHGVACTLQTRDRGPGSHVFHVCVYTYRLRLAVSGLELRDIPYTYRESQTRDADGIQSSCCSKHQSYQTVALGPTRRVGATERASTAGVGSASRRQR